MLAIAGIVCGLVFGLHAHGHPTTNEPGQSSSPSANVNLTIDLGYSSYQGSSVSKGVTQWLGIRYGAAPVGNLRFRAPQDPVTDNKVYQAKTVGDRRITHSKQY